MSAADKEGAFAFTRAYFSELNDVAATGNVQQALPFHKSTCSGCAELEAQISAPYRSGGKVLGAQLNVQQLRLGESGPSFAKVTAYADASSSTIVASDGQRQMLPGGRGDLYLLLVREGDHWIIDSLNNALAKS